MKDTLSCMKAMPCFSTSDLQNLFLGTRKRELRNNSGTITGSAVQGDVARNGSTNYTTHPKPERSLPERERSLPENAPPVSATCTAPTRRFSTGSRTCKGRRSRSCRRRQDRDRKSGDYTAATRSDPPETSRGSDPHTALFPVPVPAGRSVLRWTC